MGSADLATNELRRRLGIELVSPVRIDLLHQDDPGRIEIVGREDGSLGRKAACSVTAVASIS